MGLFEFENTWRGDHPVAQKQNRHGHMFFQGQKNKLCGIVRNELWPSLRAVRGVNGRFKFPNFQTCEAFKGRLPPEDLSYSAENLTQQFNILF